MTRLLFITITTLPLSACWLDSLDTPQAERSAQAVEPECVPEFRVRRCVDGEARPW